MNSRTEVPDFAALNTLNTPSEVPKTPEKGDDKVTPTPSRSSSFSQMNEEETVLSPGGSVSSKKLLDHEREYIINNLGFRQRSKDDLTLTPEKKLSPVSVPHLSGDCRPSLQQGYLQHLRPMASRALLKQ